MSERMIYDPINRVHYDAPVVGRKQKWDRDILTTLCPLLSSDKEGAEDEIKTLRKFVDTMDRDEAVFDYDHKEWYWRRTRSMPKVERG